MVLGGQGIIVPKLGTYVAAKRCHREGDVASWRPSRELEVLVFFLEMKTDFASRQKRIRLYCRGKENGVNILKSIDEGQFQMETVREPLAEGTKRAPHLGLPKDIYTLINHYTDAKDIWDNVNMLMEGSELTKEDRESQLVDKIEVRGLIHEVEVQLGMGEFRKELENANPGQNSDYYKDKMLLMQAQENGVALDEEQLLFLAADDYDAFNSDVDEAPTAQTMFMANLSSEDLVNDEAGRSYDSDILSEDLALNMDNVFQADDCDAFDSDVDEAPMTQTMFMANLSYADLVNDEAGPSYDSDILSEYVKDNVVPVVHRQACLLNSQLNCLLGRGPSQGEHCQQGVVEHMWKVELKMIVNSAIGVRH
nr:hypothetical protein [Tanacetum cinerariifolium]